MNTPAGKLSRMDMGPHPDSGRWLGRVFALWQIACGMAALVMLGLVCVPLDSLREYGGLVRRPEDVSLERFTRFQQVCWFLTASVASLSAGAWIGQRGVTDFLRRLWRPTTDGGIRVLAVSCSLCPTSDSQPADEQVAGERFEVREPHGLLKPLQPGPIPQSAVHAESHAAWGGEGADRADDCQLANAPATDESPTPSRSPHQDAHGYGWLAFILCVGAALRLSLLSMPMAYDEAYSWINFASRPLPQALGDLNSTNNHLFNTFCMFVTGRLFGPQEWALRIGVMCCGLATLPVGFVWARRWMGTPTALLTTALLAVSPLLVTYSADARGYEYMMLAAVLLDDAMAKLASRQGRSERSWVQAGLAVVLGVWSMIIMGYAILASVLWYVLSGGHSGSVAFRSAKERSYAERTAPLGATLRQMVLLGWLTAIGSSLIYIPGYICRGTLFLNDPVMRQATSDSWGLLAETRQGLVGAWDFWTEGAIPASVMGVAVLAGLWSWPRDRSSRLRLLSPFVVVVALNFVRHVNPPPRIYLWLMPWVCLLAARGVVWGTQWMKAPREGTAGLVLVVLGLGIWHGIRQWPVLLPSDNRLSYISVPEVVQRLQREVASAPTASHRLIVPLPCDLPSIFYMDRAGFRIPHNGIPQPGERVWLIARQAETPSAVLQDGLVQLSGWQDRVTTWQVVDRYQTLTLYSARVLTAPTTGSEE